MKRLRLILGDQLNSNHSWFKSKDENTYYCMFELKQEMEYVNHHIQKVVGFFLAMRSFKEELEKSGHTLIYESIDTPCFAWSLEKNLTRLIKELNISLFEYQMPDEYRLDLQLKRFCDSLKISFKAYDTEHFLSTRDEIKTIYGNDKEWVMEKFYRSMRKKHNLLMQEGKPLKNKWNFDNQNRKKWKSNGQSVPYKRFYNEAKDLLKQLNRMQIDTIGKMETSYFD